MVPSRGTLAQLQVAAIKGLAVAKRATLEASANTRFFMDSALLS